MDEASALADLREIAPQLRTLVLLDAHGVPIASTADDLVQLGAAVARLLEAAKFLRPGGERGVERLHVATGAGSVFAVTSGERTLAALGPADATPDLAFYDLRTALDRLTNGAPA